MNQGATMRFSLNESDDSLAAGGMRWVVLRAICRVYIVHSYIVRPRGFSCSAVRLRVVMRHSVPYRFSGNWVRSVEASRALVL